MILGTKDAGEILEGVAIINISSASMKLFILIVGMEAVLDPLCFQAVGQEINLKGSELLPVTYIIYICNNFSKGLHILSEHASEKNLAV